jgi:hypothetical protein
MTDEKVVNISRHLFPERKTENTILDIKEGSLKVALLNGNILVSE